MRMLKAVLDGKFGIANAVRAIHGLPGLTWGELSAEFGYERQPVRLTMPLPQVHKAVTATSPFVHIHIEKTGGAWHASCVGRYLWWWCCLVPCSPCSWLCIVVLCGTCVELTLCAYTLVVV